jgi:hypothetical protein
MRIGVPIAVPVYVGNQTGVKVKIGMSVEMPVSVKGVIVRVLM